MIPVVVQSLEPTTLLYVELLYGTIVTRVLQILENSRERVLRDYYYYSTW